MEKTHVLEEMTALKEKVLAILDFNENSVTSIISEATNNSYTLESIEPSLI